MCVTVLHGGSAHFVRLESSGKLADVSVQAQRWMPGQVLWRKGVVKGKNTIPV